MSNGASPTPPSGGGGNDGQVIGHLVGAFSGVFLTVLVDFGVPLSDAQQRDLLSLVVTGWALFAGAYAWLSRARHPVTQPPAATGQTAATDLVNEARQRQTGSYPTGYTATAPPSAGPAVGSAPAWPPATSPQSWPTADGRYGYPVDDGRPRNDQPGPDQLPHDGRYEQG